MNYVSIFVVTVLEVHFSVLKNGVSQYFCPCMYKSFVFGSTLTLDQRETTKVPFKESLFTRRPYLQHLRAAHPKTNSYLNEWRNPEISKVVHWTCNQITYFKSATKSEMNCPLNVVSYAEIAFKKLIFMTVHAHWLELLTAAAVTQWLYQSAIGSFI